jgi:autotransporter-associated beta strand protein
MPRPTRIGRALAPAAAALGLALAPPAAAQPSTWTGAVSTSWNTAGNWSPAGVPNSAGRTVTFDATASGFVVNIGTSVTAGSLTFDNIGPGPSYSLTSSAGQTLTLAGSTDILVTDAVAAPQTINLANVAAGSLLFTGTSTNSLLIRNQTTSTGTARLVIGPNTRIAAADTGGVLFTGTGHTLVSGNIVAAPGGLTKEGGGTLTLSGTNAFTGVTRLRGGLLALDYSTAANSKLPSGTLQSTGGELSLLAHPTLNWTEFVPSTALNGGHTTFRLNTGTGALADVGLDLASIARSPTATADFDRDAGGTFFTSNANTNGILGGALTADNGAGWASASAGTIVPLPAASYSPTFTAGTNVNMTADTTTGTVSINSLRINASAVTLSIFGNLTVQSGGILQTPAGGGAAIQVGALLAPAGQPLVVHTYSSNPLTISSRIDAPDGLVKTGFGVLTLSGNNSTLTGPIDVNRGDLKVTSSFAVNSASALRFNDTRGDRDQVFTVEIAGDLNPTINRPIQLSLDSATFATRFSTGANLNSRVTLSGVISSAAGAVTPLTIGTSVTGPDNGFNLIGTNTFTGPVTLAAGTLGIDANASLGNAANTLTLDVGTSMAGGLEFLNSGVTVARPVRIASTTRVVSNGTDVNTISGVISDGDAFTGTLVKAGTGTLVLTGANTYTSSTRIDAGTLRVGADANLGAPSAELAISGGTLATTSTFAVSAARNIFLGLPAGGPGTGTIDVAAGTTLTVPGLITDSGGALGALEKAGPGTLVLTGANSYDGSTTVRQGELRANADAALGSAFGPVAVGPLGSLTFTGSTATARAYSLTGAPLAITAGQTLTLNGAVVGGGFLRGPGTYVLTGGAALTGVTTLSGTTISQTGPASLTNFTHGGALTNAAGQTLTWNGGANAASGRVTVNGTVTASEFVNNGDLRIAPTSTGALLNGPGGSMVLGGGSTTFLGTRNTNPRGTIDLAGGTLDVRGGLLVNAARRTTAPPALPDHGILNGTTVINYGARARGDGYYDDVIAINGGDLSGGFSPGVLNTGTFNVNGGGGGFTFEITDAGPSATFPSAPGTPGNNPGWDRVYASARIRFTATPADRFTITMATQLPPPAAPDTAGPMANFDPTAPYSWLFVNNPTGAVVGLAGNPVAIDPAAINFVTAGTFLNPSAGMFSLRANASNTQVFIDYTPVPEPAGLLAVGATALAAVAAARRRSARPGYRGAAR